MDISIHGVKVIRLQPIEKFTRNDRHIFYHRVILLESEKTTDKVALFSDDKETLKVIEDE